MKRHTKKVVCIVSNLFVILMLLSSCTKSILYFPGSVQHEVDKAVGKSYDGMIVHVNLAKTSADHTAGWKDKKKKIPATKNSLFKIASISKLYIAVATVKLINSGKLSLDNTLEELLPEVAGNIEFADKITLKMLLQHRSGIPEYIYKPGFAGSDPSVDHMTTIALIYKDPAKFEPNKEYAYSNTNYLLIGEILNRTLGHSYHKFIRSEILSPLQLEHTYSLSTEVDSNEMMSGYFKDSEDDLKSVEIHTRPGGEMVATAEDVSLFLRALVEGSLLTEKEQEIYNSVASYEHTGWVNGYTSIAKYHKDIDAVIVQFVNTSKGELFWIRLKKDYNRIVKAVKKEYF
ncbi:MAG: serine hydrolase domain-containing protein [Flavicella sp.]